MNIRIVSWPFSNDSSFNFTPMTTGRCVHITFPVKAISEFVTLSIVRYERCRVVRAVYMAACFWQLHAFVREILMFYHHKNYDTDIPWNNFLLDTTYPLYLTCYQSILWISVFTNLSFLCICIFCIFDLPPHQHFWL